MVDRVIRVTRKALSRWKRYPAVLDLAGDSGRGRPARRSVLALELAVVYLRIELPCSPLPGREPGTRSWSANCRRNVRPLAPNPYRHWRGSLRPAIKRRSQALTRSL